MRIPTYLSTALLTISLSAVAQIKVCIGGDLDRLSPTEIQTCKAKSEGLRHQAQARGTQGNWRFIVVCDEAGWNEYASFNGNARTSVLRSAEQVDVEFRTTFVRGSRLRADDPGKFETLLTPIKENSSTHVRTMANAQQPASVERQGTNLIMARR